MIEAWLRLSEMIASASSKQRLEHAAVGVETGGEDDRVVLAEVLGDRLLELAMERLRAADEAHRGHAEAEFIHRALRRRDDLGVVGEAEVIVGAEIDGLALAFRPGDADPSALRSGQQALAFREARRLDVVEGRAEVGRERRRSWVGPVQLSLARIETKVHSRWPPRLCSAAGSWRRARAGYAPAATGPCG